jgi:uncharacterized protein (TIGR02145 family)
MKKFILVLFTLASVYIYSQNSATTGAGVVINDIRWATRNVDAPGTFAATPESTGMLFQWNRRHGWAATGDVNNWDNSVSSGTNWESNNDPCPWGWRVPTREELESLNRGGRWVANWNNTGINGRLLGRAPDQIFLPATGWRRGGTGILGSANGSGHYWSSTENHSESAWALSFNTFASGVGNFWRAHSAPVRCVSE